MESNLPVSIVLFLILTACNAFFTLAETALVAIRQVRLQQMAIDGSNRRTVDRVYGLLAQKPKVYATVQVGNVLTSFAAVVIAVVITADYAAHFLANHDLSHPVRVANSVITLAAALLTIVLAELVPRAIAQHSPEKTALFLAWPLPWVIQVFWPMASIALWLSNIVVRPFGLKATFATPVITEEELRMMVEASVQSGAIEEDEQEIIRNVISFGDTTVSEVMTPRIDIRAHDVAENLDMLVALIIESGHSRIPLFESNIDAVVGIVHAKDILPALAAHCDDFDPIRVARSPLLVPENRSIDELLAEFKKSRQHLAIVQDEYGGTAGLVTLEDLLEELVGEIDDEYDDAEQPWQNMDPNTFVVEARLRIGEVNEVLGSDFSEEDFDTIGGFVFGLFGHQPTVGEKTSAQGFCFEVVEIDHRSIRKIRITPEESSHSLST